MALRRAETIAAREASVEVEEEFMPLDLGEEGEVMELVRVEEGLEEEEEEEEEESWRVFEVGVGREESDVVVASTAAAIVGVGSEATTEEVVVVA